MAVNQCTASASIILYLRCQGGEERKGGGEEREGGRGREEGGRGREGRERGEGGKGKGERKKGRREMDVDRLILIYSGLNLGFSEARSKLKEVSKTLPTPAKRAYQVVMLCFLFDCNS